MSLNEAEYMDIKYLERYEIDSILKKAREGNPKHHLIFQTLWRTGLRVSELTDIKVDDIDFSEGRMKVNNGVVGNFRYVPLDPQLKKSLKDYVDSNDYQDDDTLFDYTDRGIRCLMKKYPGDGCLELFTLRHSFAVHNLRSGIDPLHLMDILGINSRDHARSYLEIAGLDSEIDLIYNIDFRSPVQKYDDHKEGSEVDFGKKSLNHFSDYFQIKRCKFEEYIIR